MFTGIIELMGTVSSITTSPQTGGTTLTITSAAPLLTDCHLGDSISINGTCLTVTSFDPSGTGSFTVGIAPETLRRTNLGSLIPDSRVNLERAVSASTRMGGHFVQGHVDTVARIVEKRGDGEAVVFRLSVGGGGGGGVEGKGVLRYVVEKGYVTLDGASLTVTEVSDEEGWWEVMLISYTQEKVVMAGKEVGDDVNVEVDMVGKYVEKSVMGYFEGLGGREEGGEGKLPILEKIVARLVDERLKGVKGFEE